MQSLKSLIVKTAIAASMAASVAGVAVANDHKHKNEQRNEYKFEHMQKVKKNSIFIPGLGTLSSKLIKELDLNAEQKQNVEAIKAFTKNTFESHKKVDVKKMLNEQIQAGKLNPHALVSTKKTQRQIGIRSAFG